MDLQNIKLIQNAFSKKSKNWHLVKFAKMAGRETKRNFTRHQGAVGRARLFPPAKSTHEHLHPANAPSAGGPYVPARQQAPLLPARPKAPCLNPPCRHSPKITNFETSKPEQLAKSNEQ